MSYSGKASFEFEIERDDDVILLQVEGTSYYTEGKRFGKPEDCCPDDGNTEITSVTGPDQKDWEDKLTPSERERIMIKINEEVQDQDEPCNEDDDEPFSFQY
jgi:hypothetical protein